MIRALCALLLTGLILFSCQSEKTLSVKPGNTVTIVSNYRDTIVETDSTAEIGKACAVYFLPTNEQMTQLKDKVGEEDFYAIADDYAWYQAQSYTYLEEKGLTIVQAGNRKMRFHLSDGSLREYSPTDTANTLKVLLYDGKKQFIQTHSIDIENAYKKLSP
jgi:hypothetical protein